MKRKLLVLGLALWLEACQPSMNSPETLSPIPAQKVARQSLPIDRQAVPSKHQQVTLSPSVAPLESDPAPESELEATPVESINIEAPSVEDPGQPIADSANQTPAAIADPAVVKVLLPISTSVQETAFYCVPAVVQMVLRYFGTEVSQASLAEIMHTHPVTGTEYIDTAEALNHYLFGANPKEAGDPGYRVQTIAIGDNHPHVLLDLESRIIDNTSQGYPTLVAVDVGLIYPDMGSGNHMLLVIGYQQSSASGEIIGYYAIDPSYLVQDPIYAGLKFIPSQELFQAIIYNEDPAYIW